MHDNMGGYVTLAVISISLIMFFSRFQARALYKGCSFAVFAKCQQLNREKVSLSWIPIRLDPSCYLATQVTMKPSSLSFHQTTLKRNAPTT